MDSCYCAGYSLRIFCKPRPRSPVATWKALIETVVRISKQTRMTHQWSVASLFVSGQPATLPALVAHHQGPITNTANALPTNTPNNCSN
ncbi:hypothetical protein QR680_002134 [Steinernema hermaphroditum]|uniref:Uncharacterized protein n=1 Tax=Steinernema hermaphroditum TaxID=289476 RepID=A0AA39H2A3_9BILA|nr:hypothetical protein QR680_002134 [Steinernema hermaphroditum]